MTDIFNGITKLCHGFLTSGLAKPAAIELTSAKDGMELLLFLGGADGMTNFQLTPTTPYAQPVKGADGKVWVELSQTFFGVKIRWPAV